MELRLIPHGELQGTGYAEFYPGTFRWDRIWSPDSVYMEMDAFEAVNLLVGHFDLLGIETLSGSRLQRCIEDLQAAAKRVSQSESPREIWDYGPNYGYCQFLEAEESWQNARRNFSLMLRDLAVWMRGVHARNEPVTCLGL